MSLRDLIRHGGPRQPLIDLPIRRHADFEIIIPLRAPTENGEVLARPALAAIPELVHENRQKLDRRDVRIDGVPLAEMRARAKREVLHAIDSGLSLDTPLILAGHQPELSHPGVWVKNFALNRLARHVGGTPLHLIVDSDTLKSTALRFPVFEPGDPQSVHLESLAFDRFDHAESYEERGVHDWELFNNFATQLQQSVAWPFEPLLTQAWPIVTREPGERIALGERFTRVRQHFERAWGCQNHEFRVSQLAQTDAFAAFARHILTDLPCFREIYNASIRAYRLRNGIRSQQHPVPELAEGEAPFWVQCSRGPRNRATASSDPRTLRPRALTLTLFARLVLGDFFIHGIGGGKYDEITDAILRDYFRIEPPAFQVLSATLHLPLPGFTANEESVKSAEHHVRELHWNPQRQEAIAGQPKPEDQRLIATKMRLIEKEPQQTDRAARREWFRELQQVTAQLRGSVAEALSQAEAERDRLRVEAQANAILTRRDYPWLLFPEATLKPFLQQFLNPSRSFEG